MPINVIQLYINVYTKQFVSIGGSPTSMPPQYYGDTPTFQIFPVIPPPSGNPNQPYLSYNLAGFTMNATFAGAPDATNPPTPFASYDSMVWTPGTSATGGYGYFQGTVDMTQVAVGDFIGTLPNVTAYFNFDVFDATLKRTTLIQSTFQLNASIDTVVVGPAPNAIQFLTLAQALGQFVLIGGTPGKFITFKSPDGTKTKTLSLGNDGEQLFQ